MKKTERMTLGELSQLLVDEKVAVHKVRGKVAPIEMSTVLEVLKETEEVITKFREGIKELEEVCYEVKFWQVWKFGPILEVVKKLITLL